MTKGMISMFTLANFCFYLLGCYSITSLEIDENNLENIKTNKITKVILKDDEEYEFEINGMNLKPHFSDSTLIGWVRTKTADDAYDLKEIQILTSNLKTIYYEKNNTANVISIFAGILLVTIAIVWIVSELGKVHVGFPTPNPIGI